MITHLVNFIKLLSFPYICKNRLHVVSVVVVVVAAAAAAAVLTSAKEVMFSSLFGCLSVCLLATLHKTSRTDLHEIFSEGWQLANEQTVKFGWRCGSPSGYRNCFSDSSLLGDTESCINRLRCATLQCTACTRRYRHSNYDVIASPAHGMHCLRA